MRTLQEKYNGINEGKFTKDQFLRDARMEQPNLVTKFNGYDDAVQILKNRGMIREAYSTEESFKDYSDDALADMIINSSRFEGNEESIARVKQELARRKEGIKEWSPYGSMAFSGEKEKEKEKAPLSSLQVGDLVYVKGVSGDYVVVKDKKEDGTVGVGDPHNNRISYQDGNKEAEVIKRAYLKEARLTNKSLTDYRYKPTNDMDKYPYEQILRGLRVELEGLNILGTPTPEEYTKALGKVLKNLEKDTIYYTNKIAGVSKKVDLHDKMVDVTAKNSVDTFNGLKKAQLKEAIKGVIKNILSEGNEFGEGEGVYEMYGDSDGDYEYDKEVGAEAEMLYDKGKRFATAGEPAKGEALRQAAIEKGSWLGWGVEDFPPYEEEDDIPHPLGYEDQDEIDYDDENFSDPFIDGDLDEQKSEKELRAEWEKHQATCHPEDKMSYMEWRSEQGIEDEELFESVSLKDIL